MEKYLNAQEKQRELDRLYFDMKNSQEHLYAYFQDEISYRMAGLIHIYHKKVDECFNRYHEKREKYQKFRDNL